MIQRLTILAISAMAVAMPLTFIASNAQAEDTVVERQCQNGVCGQSEYVNGKVQITVSSESIRPTHFNFRTNPGAQIEIGGSYSFDRAPGDTGTYSVQACDRGGVASRSTCTRWATFDWTSGPSPVVAAPPKQIGTVGRGLSSSQDNEARARANAEFAADQTATGKSAEECQASLGRCLNRAQDRGVAATQECHETFRVCASSSNRNRGGGPTSILIDVVKAVDVSAEKFGEGGKTGALPKGTKVSLIEPCADDWCHVQFRTGTGWVYNGDDYKSLDVP